MKNNFPFIVGIIMMAVITEYDRYRLNKFNNEITAKYRKQADDIFNRYKNFQYVYPRLPSV